MKVITQDTEKRNLVNKLVAENKITFEEAILLLQEEYIAPYTLTNPWTGTPNLTDHPYTYTTSTCKNSN